MNHYEYQCMIDEQKRILNKTNREAWKYMSGNLYQKPFFSKFITFVFKGMKSSIRCDD